MKGFTGLLIAAILGLAGAVCNWLYLQRASNTLGRVSFIAIRPDVQLNIGDPIKDEDLQRIDLPENTAGNLSSVAPEWSAKAAVIGQRANRIFHGGEIVLEMDLAAPAQQQLAKTLQENEVAVWVPIDPRSVVAEQINPGDLVSFEVPRAALAGGTASVPTSTPALAGVASEKPEIIGPFRVLAIGARREPTNVQQAFRGRVGTETTLTSVAELKQGQLDPLSARLSEVLGSQNRQGLIVLLHSARHPAP
jgi:Flp pilus assembly protein CpaB